MSSFDQDSSAATGASESAASRKEALIDTISQHIRDAYVAAWEFKGAQKGELSLDVGNLLVVMQRGDEWWKGVNVSRAKKGWFPATSVRPASSAERDQLREALEQLRAGGKRQRSGRSAAAPGAAAAAAAASKSSSPNTSSNSLLTQPTSPSVRRAVTGAINTSTTPPPTTTNNNNSNNTASTNNSPSLPRVASGPRAAVSVASGLSPLVAHRAPPAPPPGASPAPSGGSSSASPALLALSPQRAASTNDMPMAARTVRGNSVVSVDSEPPLSTLPLDDAHDDYASIPAASHEAVSSPRAAAIVSSPPRAERAASRAAERTEKFSVLSDDGDDYPVPLNALTAVENPARGSFTTYTPVTPIAPPSSAKINYHTLPGEAQMLAELDRMANAQVAATAAAAAPAAQALPEVAPAAAAAARPAELKRVLSNVSNPTRAQMFRQLVDSEMTQKPWYDGSLTRDMAIKILTGEPIGTFLIRPSTRPSCLAISHIEADGVTVGHGILHHWDGPERIGWSIENQPITYHTLDDLLNSLPLRHDDLILKRIQLDKYRDPAAAGAAPAAASSSSSSSAASVASSIVSVPLSSLPKPDAPIAAGVYGADYYSAGEQARLLSRSHSLQLKAMAETGAVQGVTNVNTGRRLQPIRTASRDEVDSAAPRQLLSHATNRTVALLAKTPCAPLPPPMEGEQYRVAPWFHCEMTRQKAIDVLSGKPNGAFVVRPSSQVGCVSLSHVHPNGTVGHGIIHRWPKPGAPASDKREGWSIENEPQTFNTLGALLESLPLKPNLVEPELVTDDELAAAASGGAKQQQQPAKLVSPRAHVVPTTDSQYVLNLPKSTDAVNRGLQSMQSVSEALIAAPTSSGAGGAAAVAAAAVAAVAADSNEPPATMSLVGMRGRLVRLYCECVVEYRGADLRYELPLRPGDRVSVSDMTPAGWWFGRLLGSTRCGWFRCDCVQWFPETLDLFVQSIGFGLDMYRALLANGFSTVRHVQNAAECFANEVQGLDTGQRQAISTAIAERRGDLPPYMPSDVRPPMATPQQAGGVPQPQPYSGTDEIVTQTARDLGGLQTRLILCVAVPASRVYWIDLFDSRDRVARIAADTSRRLATPFDGSLEVFLVETSGERRLEPQATLAECQLRAMSQLVVRPRK